MEPVCPLPESPRPRGVGIDPRCRRAYANHVPLAQSSESLLSDDSGEIVWDKVALLNLSDSVRASLKYERGLGSDADKLSSFLEAALRDDERRYPTLDFETIEYAHLDKLLSEILQFAEMMKISNLSTDLPLRFRVDVAHCKKLRSIWRYRFREQYFMIDQLRCTVLVEGGQLKDVLFNASWTYDLAKWQGYEIDPVSELEGNLQFEAGQ